MDTKQSANRSSIIIKQLRDAAPGGAAEKLQFLMQIIAKARQHAALADAFQRHQRPVGDDFIAIIKRDFTDPLVGGNRRFQHFFIQHIFRRE